MAASSAASSVASSAAAATSDKDSAKVKVAVRIRPLNRRELALGCKVCLAVDGDEQIVLHHPHELAGQQQQQQQDPSSQQQQQQNASIGKNPKSFAFDHCFWSVSPGDANFASQETVFNALGVDILDNAFGGYNACIFAYGQTGSGKSYSMMGTDEQKGIIPRLCDRMFERIADTDEGEDLECKVEVSYMEIYNEKVHDLLDPRGNKQNLKVREHNILGPYVDGLSQLAVSSFDDIDSLMSEGNKQRTVAATNMNSESSRSHAVFNVILTQSRFDRPSGLSGEKVSKMSLVDLAGSERAQKTGAEGSRLREGSNINKSLSTLGLVISSLADQAAGKGKGKFVPYRDSVLTWILKDNLGGNSRTVMVATLSPAADNYEETLSTLRYADRAKRIVNHAVINEDPNARIIRELREEVEILRSQLGGAGGGNLVEQLRESEKLMKEMTKTWEEKLQETEKIHEQRQQALEKMGISVQTSGIKVENDKNYLVNLNADPSLNELLVYYLKEFTKVGRPDAPVEQDIQLSGLGIVPEHAILEVREGAVYCTTLNGARTCVNGSVIQERTLLRHGDRLLWGNNHFFRINCPKIGASNSFNENLSGGGGFGGDASSSSSSSSSSSAREPERMTAWEYAQQELMLKELSNDPIQQAMAQLERQHEEDKQEALEKQRQMYEKQMELLLQHVGPGLGSPSGPQSLSPSSSLHGVADFNNLYTCWSPANNRYGAGIQHRDALFKQSLARLREDLIKANALVREANSLALEMGRNVQFQVTLQIPAQNLSPRKRGVLLSEPAILVKRRNKENQVWSCDKLEDKIIKMREMYLGEEVHHPLEEEPNPDSDPFYESVENHKLIGVANVFMEALFHEAPLDYQVPIISQHGEVTGRLHVVLQKIHGQLDRRDCYPPVDEDGGGAFVTCQLSIKEATGLPPSLANFVFCQYAFWGDPQPIVAAPDMAGSTAGKDSVTFAFNHARQFKVRLTEEFLEHLLEGGALSVEIWGHRATGFTHGQNAWQVESLEAKSHSLVDRWTEVKRRVELWTEILELNEQGDYCPVEVSQNNADVLTGGTYQLRQGHSRRIKVSVKPVANSGTLPIICESIGSISVGSISPRSKIQKGLDSYQEEDLNVLREKWSDALNKRKAYLDEQIKRLMHKKDKTDQDTEREKALIDQWIGMTEERNAVLLPAPGSGIPGAPADWRPPAGMEQHIPVIFLDLNAEDMSTNLPIEGRNAAGINSILPKEHGGKMFTIPTLVIGDGDVCCVASWDSSVHDSIHLNRLTQTNERIYLILKCVVRLSHPAAMELILRKRLCINVFKPGMMDRLKSIRVVGKGADFVTSTGVTYEIVSNIPRASEEMEDRETLAMMAASGEAQEDDAGETYIEKYIRGVSNVESILALDRLRQEVALKETLTSRGQMLTMRKTVSVPNINHMGRSESFTYGLDAQFRADSVQDLTSPFADGALVANAGGGGAGTGTVVAPYGPVTSTPVGEGSFKRRSVPEAPAGSRSGGVVGGVVPFKAGVASPQTKLVKPMMTVIEEKERKGGGGGGGGVEVRKSGSFIGQIVEDDEDEFQDFECYKSPTTIATTTATTTTPTTLATSSSADNVDSGIENSEGNWKGRGGRSEEEEEEEEEEGEGDGGGRGREEEEEENGDPEEVESLIDHDSDEGRENEKRENETLPILNGENETLRNERILEENEDSARKNADFGDDEKSPLSENGDDETEKGESETVISLEEKLRTQTQLNFATDIASLPDSHSPFPDTARQTLLPDTEPKPSPPLPDSMPNPRPPLPNGISQKPRPVVVSNSDSNLQKADNRSSVGLRSTTDNRSSAATIAHQMSLHRQELETSVAGDANSEGEDEDTLSTYSFGSRADLDHFGARESPVPSWIQLGSACVVQLSTGPQPGTVSYVGPTEFADHTWIGVSLEQPLGKNDGSVKGTRYFRCKKRHGVFVKHDKLIMDKKRTSRSSFKRLSNPGGRV